MVRVRLSRVYKLSVFVLQLLKNEFTFHYLHYRLASVASVPVRLNNRNDRTTQAQWSAIEKGIGLFICCVLLRFFFNLQTPTGRYGKCLTRTVPLF